MITDLKLLDFIRNFGKRNLGGFTLAESLVTIAIVSIAGMALVKLTSTNMKSNKSAQIRAEVSDVKRTISNLIDCEQTLGVAIPTTCSGPVTLKKKNGNPLATNSKIGDWTIESSCEVMGSPASNGLSIYATKRRADGTFLIDPIRNLPLDRSHPISALYKPSVRLCADNFFSGIPAPVTSCPNGIEAIDFGNKTVTCATALAIDCYDVVTRKSNGGGRQAICLASHTVTGCAMISRGGEDSDTRFLENGCEMDNDEYDGDSTLRARCCRIVRP
jgi:prepilin-type N-terminal cleavage/methylation domain-containing protein